MPALLLFALWMAAPAQVAGGASREITLARCFSNQADSIDACTQAFAQARNAQEQSRILFAKGMLETNAKEFAIAATLLREAIALAPRDPGAHVFYAWALDAAGDHNNADAHYRLAAQGGLRHATEWKADPVLRALIQNTGGGAQFFFTVAQGFERIGENLVAKDFYLEAADGFEKRADALVIEAYNGALRMDPRDAESHLRVAYFWKQWDDRHSEEVIQHLTEAASLDPTNADTHFELAHAYLTKGESAKAIPELEAAVKSRPDFAEAQHDLQLAILQSGEPPAQAAEGLDSPAAKQELRTCIDQNGIRCETACRKALKIGLSARNAAQAHTFLAQVLEGDAALAEYRAAIEADPTYAVTYVLFAHRIDEWPEKAGNADAAELLQNATKLRPDWVGPRERLASLLWKRKRYPEAIAELREASLLDADDAALSAKLKTMQSDYASFQEQYRQASAEVRGRPDNLFAQQHYAAAAALMGMQDEARKTYRALYKLDPSGGRKLAESLLYTDFADVACAIYPQVRIMNDSTQAGIATLEADLATCAQKFPHDLTALKRLAELQARGGDLQAARVTYEQILQRDGAYFDDHPDDRVLYDRTVAQR